MSNPKTTDIFNIMSKLTLHKIWNGLKLLSSYYVSKWLNKPVQWGFPVSISFEPTTSCNLRCPECPSGLRAFTRPIGMLQSNFFKETIDSIYKDLLYLIFYFQGEPYLNPAFLEMVAYAASKKIYTATSTNGHYLTYENAVKTVHSGLDRLIISIDGTTQEVYQQYRIGGKLEKVLAGAKNMVSAKQNLHSKKPHIIFQFLVVKPNEHQIDDVKKLAKKIGVDEVRFKTAQVYDYETDPNNLIPSQNKYSRYIKNNDGSYKPKNKLQNNCFKMWHSNVITWDGRIVPCCFDKDAQHQLGTLQTHTFKQIWNSEAYQLFRQKLWKGRKNIDICANCSEGTSVWK